MTEVLVDGKPIDGIKSVEFEQTINYHGIRIHPTRLVPEGLIVQVKRSGIHVGPLTFFALTHGGLYPLESRYTRGAAEARRDRRLNAAG